MWMLTGSSLGSPVTKTSENKNDGLIHIVRNGAGTARYAVPAILTLVTGGGKPAVICRFSCNSRIKTWNTVSIFILPSDAATHSLSLPELLLYFELHWSDIARGSSVP